MERAGYQARTHELAQALLVLMLPVSMANRILRYNLRLSRSFEGPVTTSSSLPNVEKKGELHATLVAGYFDFNGSPCAAMLGLG